MIDRLGSLSVSQPRVDHDNHGRERPGRARDFEELVRGASQAGAEATRSGTSAASPLRLSRIGQRSREADRPDTAGAVSATSPSAPNRTRVAGAEGNQSSPPAPAPSQPQGATTQPSETAAGSAATRFVRSTSTTVPHLPRFTEVPESAQFPLGPYRQAPAEFGGDWWLVNPFTGPEPWRALEFANRPPQEAIEAEPAPQEFVRLFGPRPETSTAAVQWEQDLGFFQGTGIPEGFSGAQVEAATAEFEAWGLGEPVFYEGRYGWQVRFPDSQLPMFETTASTALIAPHLVIAEHQVRSIQEGITPPEYHPWLPERLRSA